MSDVIPSVGKDESIGLILVAALVAYAVYRVYVTAAPLAKGIAGTLGAAGTAVSNIASAIGGAASNTVDGAKVLADQAALNTIRSNEAIGGAAPIPVADQSAAETAMLNRLAGNPPATPTNPVDATSPSNVMGATDPMGNYIGLQSNIVAQQQTVMSPDTSSLLTNPIDFGNPSTNGEF